MNQGVILKTHVGIHKNQTAIHKNQAVIHKRTHGEKALGTKPAEDYNEGERTFLRVRTEGQTKRGGGAGAGEGRAAKKNRKHLKNREDMAEYDMQEMTLPNEEGKRVLFPRMRLWGQTELEELAERISYASSFTKGDIVGLVRALSDSIAAEMAMGRSVKIEGIGIFTPALGLRKGKERETGEEGESKRNAMSICLKDINFKADKEFIRNTARRCTLERSKHKFRRSQQKYTPEERLKLAQEYLTAHSYMTVADYSRLTGLLHVTAARELVRLAQEEGSGIGSTGKWSHKVYVAKPVANP